MKSLILLLLYIIYLFNFSYSQSIYSFTSNQDYSIGQYFYIIDSKNNQIIQNITLNLPCTINGVISVNQTNALLFCQATAGVNDEFYLTSIDINDGTYQNLKTVETSLSYIGQIGQLHYFNNILHLPVAIHNHPKNVSLVNLNFNTNTFNYNSFNSINYKYENGLPIGGFDYNNDIMYLLYPSENKTTTSTTYPSNIIAFKINNIKGTQKFFNSISNLNNEFTELLFVNSQGQLYSVNGNPETSSFDICQVNLSELNCNNVLSVPVQSPTNSFSFLNWYLSGSKQQIIFTSNINNGTQILFDIYNISNFAHTQLTINNIWDQISNQYSFTYFFLQ